MIHQCMGLLATRWDSLAGVGAIKPTASAMTLLHSGLINWKGTRDQAMCALNIVQSVRIPFGFQWLLRQAASDGPFAVIQGGVVRHQEFFAFISTTLRFELD